MTGKIMISVNQAVQNGNFRIPTENLGTGIYTIQLQSGDMTGTVKLL